MSKRKVPIFQEDRSSTFRLDKCRWTFYIIIMNKFRSYLDEIGMSVDEFAEEHNFHRTTVFKWVNGTTTPHKRFWPKLLTITNGRITPNDFLIPSRTD